jgi:predicted CxxxxCH...CXXCH cytochrome family protein
MRMLKGLDSRLHLVLGTVLAALTLALVTGTPAQAAPQYGLDCTKCHTMPPKDSANERKDPYTGAVPGSHEKHAGADKSSCVKCHGEGVQTYATGHRNKVIELNSGLGYDPRRVFLNQTSVPPNPLGSCATVACHSNGKLAYRATPSWGDKTPLTCDSCHDSAPTTAAHGKHIATYSYGCVQCHSNHAVEAKPFGHATSAGRAIDVRFSTAPNTAGSFASNQCSNLYCHSNGRGGAPNQAATWGSGTLNCSGCHGTASSTGLAALSGKHAQHVNNSSVLGNNFGCKECHSPTVGGTSNYALTDRTQHVNSTINMGGQNLGLVSAGGCSTSYCHSDGKGNNRSVTWTQTEQLDCNGCHGTGNAIGAPDYASGAAGSATANSHAKHAAAAGDCVNCHSKTTTTGLAIIAGSQHVDGFINYTSGSKSFGRQINKGCSDISCHSGNGIVKNVATAQWGATLNCNSCHDTLSASHDAHTSVYNCATCHSDSSVVAGALKTGKHMNAAADVVGVKITTYTAADQTCANSCHTGASAPQWNVAASGQCGSCHNVTSPLISSAAHSQHFTAANGPHLSQSVNGCQVCHNYTSSASHVDGIKNLNAGFSATGSCSTCHKQSSTRWLTAATVTCESCHSTAGGALSVINKTAPDKTLAATKGHGAQGQGCVICHDSTSAHIGVAGGTSRLQAGLTGAANAECNSCHSDALKVTARTLGVQPHRLTGLGSLCSDCHDPHGTTNSMMVKSSINGSATSFPGTSGFANGDQNGVCQVCHTGTRYFTKAGVTAPEQHVDSSTNCLECHKHSGDTGLAFAANGACDACHGYPPAPRKVLAGDFTLPSNGDWANARFESYSGGGGAHLVAAHLSKDIKPSDGWAPCLTCHNEGPATHARVLPLRTHVENVTVKVDPQYIFSPDAFMSYTSAKLVSGGANNTGSCFNVSCHFRPSPQWSIER